MPEGRLTGGAGGRSAYLSSGPAETQTKKKKPSGLMGILPYAIPTALAAGASFIPGVGTVAATGLGAIGEILRQKTMGEDFNLGKVGSEAAISAVPGGLGLLAKGARAAKTVSVTSKGLKTAEAARPAAEVAEVAAGTPSGILGRFSERMKGNARGIKPGGKTSGQEQLGVRDASELNAFLDSQGVKGKSARQQLAALEKVQAGRGQQIGEIVQKNNRPLAAGEASSLQQRVQAEIEKIAGLPKKKGPVALLGLDGKALARTSSGQIDHAYETALASDLAGVKDLKSANDLRKRLDADAINYGRNSNSPDPVREQIAKAYRRGLDAHVSEAIPELKDIQRLYGKGASAEDFLKDAAKNPKGITLPFNAATIPGDVVQSAQAGLGEATSNLGGIMQKVSPLGGFAGEAIKQGLVRTPALAATGMENAEQASAEATKDAEQATELENSLDMEVAGAGAAADASGSVFSPQALQALAIDDIQRTGGKNLGQIKLLRDMFGEDTKAKKPLSAEANKQSANARSGMDALQTLRDEMAGGAGPTKNAFASLAGNIGRGAAGTQSFNAAREEIIDVLARLRTGAAITKTEEERFKRALPSPFDSPEVQDQKLRRYETLFNRILSNQSQGSPDLEVAGVGGL